MRTANGPLTSGDGGAYERHPSHAPGNAPRAPAEDDGSDVGSELREARQRLGLSVDDVARSTKIRVTMLLAIEANRRDQLPAPIYMRGFVRAFAREVGLDPDDTARRFVDQFEPRGDAASSASTLEPRDAESRQPALAPAAIDRDVLSRAATQWLIITVVVVGLVGYGVVRSERRPPTPRNQTSQSDRAIESAPPTATDRRTDRPEIGTAGSSQPTATDGRVLHVEVRAVGPCWLSARADGSPVAYQLMQPGEKRAFDVHDAAALRVGDAGALEFSINGAAGRSLGRAGQPVNVRITPDNFREFLAR
jgi:cytoskeleton protein RodZ